MPVGIRGFRERSGRKASISVKERKIFELWKKCKRLLDRYLVYFFLLYYNMLWYYSFEKGFTRIMVDRINGIGNYNTYPVIKGPASGEEESDFAKEYGQGLVSDPYGDKGVIYESAAPNEPKKDEPESGVRLDLSSAATAPESDIVEEDFIAKAKRLFFDLIQGIREFASKLWNGNDGTPEVPEELLQGDFRKNAAASGFKTAEERLQELLNNDNRGHLVKNSDLLTYYDRSGRISSVNASDRIRIMEGDYRDIYL